MICVIRGFLVAYGKKSLEEIFNKIWPEARNVMDPRNTRRARIFLVA